MRKVKMILFGIMLTRLALLSADLRKHRDYGKYNIHTYVNRNGKMAYLNEIVGRCEGERYDNNF